MTRRARALVGFALLLSGCGTGLFQKPSDTIKINRGDAVILLVSVAGARASIAADITAGCKAGIIKAATCVEAGHIDAQILEIWEQLKVKLRDPDIEIDWAAVGRAIELIAKLASKAL